MCIDVTTYLKKKEQKTDAKPKESNKYNVQNMTT